MVPPVARFSTYVLQSAVSGRREQTLADYAAIALAPILVFAMLYSLAGFLVLIFYSGHYPARVMSTLFFYTMGVTASARMSIEQSRQYSMGYIVALGLATLLVLLRFVGNPLASITIIAVVGYLADRIVHDCTIVDDSIDSSGQGLIDSAKGMMRLLRGSIRDNDGQDDTEPVGEQRTADDHDESSKSPAFKREASQPGRTVLYLALAALPLFGLGQFFLGGGPGGGQAARQLLTIYLFASLSLLVVTSFLNLRRYLRQRDTEMPVQTTVAWLVGGMVMIAAILLLALLAPLPGRTLASFQMPVMFDTDSPLSSSKYGWGGEGAEQSSGGDAPSDDTREEADSPKETPGLSTQTKKGAPPGGTSGQRKDGPVGNETGGQKGKPKPGQEKSAKDASQQGEPEKGKPKQGKPEPPKGDQSPSETGKPGDTENPGNQGKASKNGKAAEKGDGRQKGDPAKDAPQDQKSSKPQSTPAEKQPSDQDQSGKPDNAKQPNTDSQPNSDPPQESKTPPEPGTQPNSGTPPESDKKPVKDPNTKPETEPENKSEADSKSSESQDTTPPKSESQQAQNRSPDSASTQTTPQANQAQFSELLNSATSWLKSVFIAVLVGIVLVYLYLHHEVLIDWINRWMAGRATTSQPREISRAQPQAPEIDEQPFASFKNPIGQQEPGKAIVITFQALEAWGREQGVRRNSDETPNEFAARLVTQFPALKRSAAGMVGAYNRIVYGRAAAGSKDIQAAAAVWNVMRPSLEE
ncbi:DUF4129 domain-containing protein [Neorhodopirellula lusitana]|uniref:DUF4129 domain-containing protein n=1 Tax=Neorhodopirellula lusitana TaxID=445327 RepID=UPI00384B6A11